MIPCDSLHDKDTLKHGNNTLGGQIIICNLKVGSALSLSNMTRAGEVVVNKGPPLTVDQGRDKHGGGCFATFEKS